MGRHSIRIRNGALGDIEDNSMTLGKKIYELRKLKGWRQKDLEIKSGVPRGHISRIERNDYKTWHVETIIKLSRGFGIHPRILFQAIYHFYDYEDWERGSTSQRGSNGLGEDPDLQLFFAGDWPSMTQSEKDLVRRVIQVAKAARDQRLGKAT